MTDGYDATAKLVNEEIAKLGDAGTCADLITIDNKLELPKGTSFEMEGYADYFAFKEDCPPTKTHNQIADYKPP